MAIGFRLKQRKWWGLVTGSAKRSGGWQFTYGDTDGPAGDTIRSSPQMALLLALEDGFKIVEVRGGIPAKRIAAEVKRYRRSVDRWIAAIEAGNYDLDLSEPAWLER